MLQSLTTEHDTETAAQDMPQATVTAALCGWRAISKYLCVCESTAHVWAREHGLPVMWRPDGRVYTTVSLIDQWVLARAELRWQALAEAKKQRLARDTSSE